VAPNKTISKVSLTKTLIIILGILVAVIMTYNSSYFTMNDPLAIFSFDKWLASSTLDTQEGQGLSKVVEIAELAFKKVTSLNK
jgi:hypothetical protein